MSVNINSVTDFVETEKRVVLLQDAFRRVIAGSWSKIRIGVDLGTNKEQSWATPANLYFGLAAGTDHPPLSASPNHFLGVKSNSVGWIYYGKMQVIGMSSCRIVNGGETLSAIGDQGGLGTNSPIIGIDSDQSSRKYGMILEITKGSPNFTLDFWAASANGSYQNRYSSMTKFGANMRSESVIVDQNNYFFMGSHSIAIDETANGTLDTFCLAWSDPTYRISAGNVGVRIIS